jgi:hypothetical protein
MCIGEASPIHMFDRTIAAWYHLDVGDASPMHMFDRTIVAWYHLDVGDASLHLDDTKQQ